MYNKNMNINKLLILAFVILFAIPLSSAVSTTVVISPQGAGTVTVVATSPASNTIVTSSTTITVNSGSQVTYLATPKTGYKFDHFYDVWGSKSETSTQNPWLDSISADDTVTAVFVASGSATPVPTSVVQRQ